MSGRTRWLVLATHVPSDGTGGGMARQTVELIRALHARPDLDVSVRCRRDAVGFFVDDVGLTPDRVVVGRGGVLRRSLVEWLGRPRLADGSTPDVVVGTKHLVPRWSRARSVLVVHDVLPLDRPGDFRWAKRRLLPVPYFDSIRRADVVACVSEATAKRLRTYTGRHRRVIVAPNALSTSLSTATPEPIDALEGGRFALVVGDPSLRKNLPFVFDVWERVQHADPSLLLVRVGPPGWGVDEPSAARDRLLASDGLLELGHVSDGTLRWLYEHAAMTLCPSLLEGFGLPVLEAMAFSSPVLLSPDPAQVEVAAGHGTVVPLEVDAWVDAVRATAARHRSPSTALGTAPRWTWNDTVEAICTAIHPSEQRHPPLVLHVAQPVSEGVARCVVETARWQADHGIWPVVACPAPSELSSELESAGIDVMRWDATRAPGPATVGETIRLARAVRRIQPDLIHLHSSKAGVAGRLAARGRTPTVFQPHGWSFLAVTGLPHRLARRWEAAAARWTAGAVSVSGGEQRLAERAGITLPEHVVIPNTIEVPPRVGSAVGLRLRAELGLGAAPVVVCVGRLSEQKGQDLLLAAWPAVLAAVPSARLVLVGDGPTRDALQASAPHSVHVIGNRDDVAELLEIADVVAMPSRWEGMSIAMLEAMAAGRSVVAADVPGVGETITAHAGAVVAVDDGPGLARALIARLVDPVRAAMEGRQGRRLVTERHRPQQAQGMLLDLYRRLVPDWDANGWPIADPVRDQPLGGSDDDIGPVGVLDAAIIDLREAQRRGGAADRPGSWPRRSGPRGVDAHG